ncbi:aminotransferase class V-fold PLP-dependent enzyme [Pelagibius marinus]|uniref:aminotransferase class V-fold PLP-dependent enzyme n=1 Tax=Pelagibius marinus TaxID=2762760 RepID=UPI001872EDD3|nr:aminotransferase class V-fold PLP-dependent enzyme [Pelagibius marinus]
MSGSYKAHFQRFIEAAPGRLHFAAHSHHYWPDVTFDAQVQCWQDAARLTGGKWELVLGEVMPEVQRGIARHLNLPDPASLAFAPNTHELVKRLLSCLPAERPPRILTSDGEFHSFTRQIARLEEDGLAEVTRVPVEPFDSFAERFAAAASKGGHDMIFVSQVFFNSGFALTDLAALLDGLPAEPFVVIDGYHGFLARPSDLGGIAARAFYLAGGYKYAMSGEGVCFLHAPPGYGLRPRDTGWYAAFGKLTKAGGSGIAYAEDGGRFFGATFDPVGLYRMRAVLRLLEALGLDAAGIHAHARALQDRFLAGLKARPSPALPLERLLLDPQKLPCGNFLTFDLGGEAAAADLHARLTAAGVASDYRGSRLRFGFGLYQEAADVVDLLGRLAAL